MRRILVIGCCGSGKSTFAKKLSEKLRLPLINLDHLFWQPGWVQRDTDAFDSMLQTELQKEQWIIEGDYARTLSRRLHYADTVIFLDFGRWVCTWRVIKRWMCDQTKQAIGCPQKLDVPFLKYVFWTYPHKNRLRTLQRKKESQSKVDWFILKSPFEAERWMRHTGGQEI